MSTPEESQPAASRQDDKQIPDDSEKVIISALALFKILIYERNRPRSDATGVLLGKFIDDYTVHVVDAVPYPDDETAVDMGEMLEMLLQTKRKEFVVGWHGSTPGVKADYSGVQKWYEKNMGERAIAVVCSEHIFKRKLVIEAFRLSKPGITRQSTSNAWSLMERTSALILNPDECDRLHIKYKVSEVEKNMLLHVYKKNYADALRLKRFHMFSQSNELKLQEIIKSVINYNKAIKEENEMEVEEFGVAAARRENVKRKLEEEILDLMSSNIDQLFGMALNSLNSTAFSSI